MYWHRVCPEFWLAIQQLYIFIGVCVCVWWNIADSQLALDIPEIYICIFVTILYASNIIWL